MKAFVLATLACWTCPAASLAFPGLVARSTWQPCPRRNVPVAHGGSSATRHGAALSSRIYLSKPSEDVIERESITISPPDERFGEFSNAIEYTNGSTDGDTNSNSPLNTDATNNGRALGVLVLLTVPLAWGTYTPVVKYMYEKMDPSMPGFVFSAGYYLVAAASLGILSRAQNSQTDDDASDSKIQGSEDTEEDGASITTRGGWELGSYLFIGNGFQVIGLQTVPADRAAFLVQLTTVMVPLLSALSAGTLSAVPIQTWFACIISFLGVVIMGADDGGGEGVGFANVDQLSSSLQISQGDLLIVLAAVAYTLHVVRLGAYAPRTTPLKLAASKATTEAILSVLLVVALAFIGGTHFPSPEFVSQTGSSVSEYFQTITSAFVDGGGPASSSKESALGVSIGAILWTGWVTCAYTIYAQSFGQSRVNPTDSNLIYTTQPLFSSAFAYVLLGETLGVYGFAGAFLIGTALWLVTSSGNNSDDK